MGSYNSNSMSTQRAKVKSLEENFMDEKNYPVISRGNTVQLFVI